MAKKAMVLGGVGNMGSAIVDKLLEKGYEVSVLCRSVERIRPSPEVKLLVADRHDRERFFREMRAGGYEYVVDMICMDRQDAEDDYQAFPDVKRLVFTSTGAVYGALEGSGMPIREDYRRAPDWSYGVRKKEAEDFFLDKFAKEGFPVTILRPTVSYGKQRQSLRQIGSGSVWIDRIRKGKPILTGNPYILRNFLYCDDAANAFAGALEHDVCIGQAYNMVGLKPSDWGTYHTTMMKVLGRTVEMVEVPLEVLQRFETPEFQIGEMITKNFKFNGYYCGEKIARDIPEFRTLTTLEEGLRKTVGFLEERGLIPDSDGFPYEDEIIRAQKSIRPQG